MVDGVGVAAAQIVGQVAGHRLLAGPATDFLGQGLADVDLLAMTESVGFAKFGDFAAGPGRSLRDHHQRVAAGVVLLVLKQEFAEVVDVEGIFRNQTPG